MERKNIDKLITEALAIEAEEAQRAGAVGYMARALTQATMPHKATLGNEFKRQNGFYTLTMLAPSHIGLPYGSIPRLLVSWVTTEAIRTQCPVLELGYSLSAFMDKLGLKPTGGRWGSITRLRDQMTRLFSSYISCIYDDGNRTGIRNVLIVEDSCLWWDPKAPDQAPLWKSRIELGKRFFEEAIKSPIPVDMRALGSLKRSPMALDIYCWLTYRMSYLRKPTEIPWPVLQMQFGADYPITKQGLRDFKKNFLKQLRSVLCVYPEAKVENGKSGLLLKPSKPHVAPLPPVLSNEPHQVLLPDPVIRLQTDTYEKAKKAAPGWDVYYLEIQWRSWIANKEKPKNPDAAFIAFCRKKYQREGRP